MKCLTVYTKDNNTNSQNVSPILFSKNISPFRKYYSFTDSIRKKKNQNNNKLEKDPQITENNWKNNPSCQFINTYASNFSFHSSKNEDKNLFKGSKRKQNRKKSICTDLRTYSSSSIYRERRNLKNYMNSTFHYSKGRNYTNYLSTIKDQKMSDYINMPKFHLNHSEKKSDDDHNFLTVVNNKRNKFLKTQKIIHKKTNINDEDEEIFESERKLKLIQNFKDKFETLKEQAASLNQKVLNIHLENRPKLFIKNIEDNNEITDNYIDIHDLNRDNNIMNLPKFKKYLEVCNLSNMIWEKSRKDYRNNHYSKKKMKDDLKTKVNEIFNKNKNQNISKAKSDINEKIYKENKKSKNKFDKDREQINLKRRLTIIKVNKRKNINFRNLKLKRKKYFIGSDLTKSEEEERNKALLQIRENYLKLQKVILIRSMIILLECYPKMSI